MNPAKDSTEVIEFMALFQKLRDWIDDDPNDLEKLAADDEVLKRLCNDLGFAATFLSMNEKRQRRLFSAPVDPKFIAAWRAYEERYASPIAGIFLSDIGLDTGAAAGQRARSRAASTTGSLRWRTLLSPEEYCSSARAADALPIARKACTASTAWIGGVS
jgi:hypothetical protein